MTDKLEPLVKYGLAAAAGALIVNMYERRGKPRGVGADATLQGTTTLPTQKFSAAQELNAEAVPLAGTMLLCTQNLAVSGANQVLLNLVEGTVWRGNLVVLSPTTGPFAKEFSDLGASVRIGSLSALLEVVRDVRVAICNTIMTAHNVLELDSHGIPAMWILHEWWPGQMLVDELSKRNDKNTSPEIVKKALEVCKRTVCVCNNQLKLYGPKHGQAVFVGVPDPAPGWNLGAPKAKPDSKPLITFLTLGIVCPRKNQHWAVEAFRQWAGDRTDVRLLVVGARYIRQYEIDYVEKVKKAIGGDERVELIDVTKDVDAYYRQADVLLFTSLNEVTPMVIAESMMRSIPVITTDIAGIPEMLDNGVHGYALPPDDHAAFANALIDLGAPGAEGQRRRLQMGAAAKKHALKTFTNAGMVAQYRAIALELSPPTILLDMDGVLVDWDAGFRKAWGRTAPIDRSKSYYMERCVPASHKQAALELLHREGFFRNLPPMEGSVRAAKEMVAKGYRVLICTSPVLTSAHCAGEKFEWVREHLGPEWVRQIVLTSDKTSVRGDVLIDDKPRITGAHLPSWRQLMFDAPYNLSETPTGRLSRWADWEAAVLGLLRGAAEGQDIVTTAEAEKGDAAPTSTDDGQAISRPSSGGDLAQAVAQLPDFSHLLPKSYRQDYLAWRSGQPKGAKGELEEVMLRMEEMSDAVMNNTSEDFTEVNLYRTGYASWRRGKMKGAKGSILAVSQL